MKVYTFTAGMAGGYAQAFKFLDACVRNLGDVDILDIEDTLFPNIPTLGNSGSETLARRIIFEEKAPY